MTLLPAWSHLPIKEVMMGPCLVILLIAFGRILFSRPLQSPKAFVNEQTASATLDFVLVFPIFISLVLVLVQLALLINARLIVSYATFAAARSAVVWLEEGEGIAAERAHRAAAVGCLPISPGGLVSTGEWGSTLVVAPLFVHSSTSELTRRVLRSSSKLAYSKQATSVEITFSPEGLSPHGPITVDVEHGLYLSVPYAAEWFRDDSPGISGLPIRRIRDTFTLTHAGRARSR